MRLYTYYAHVPQHNQENELRMLALWRDHHRNLGFEPYCLQEWHAQSHPMFERFDPLIRALPSINPQLYDVACFHRWMAVSSLAGPGAVMMDYDTFLTPHTAADLTPFQSMLPGEMLKLHVWQNTTPCLVTGTDATFLDACGWFMFYPGREAKHVSDMTILEAIALAKPDLFERHSLVKCYGEPGWDSALAVHFSNACTGPAGKTPRWKHIPNLLKQHHHFHA